MIFYFVNVLVKFLLASNICKCSFYFSYQTNFKIVQKLSEKPSVLTKLNTNIYLI